MKVRGARQYNHHELGDYLISKGANTAVPLLPPAPVAPLHHTAPIECTACLIPLSVLSPHSFSTHSNNVFSEPARDLRPSPPTPINAREYVRVGGATLLYFVMCP